MSFCTSMVHSWINACVAGKTMQSLDSVPYMSGFTMRFVHKETLCQISVAFTLKVAYWLAVESVTTDVAG